MKTETFLNGIERKKKEGMLPAGFELVEVVKGHKKDKNIVELAYGYNKDEDSENAIMWDMFGQAYRSKNRFNAVEELTWDKDEGRPQRVNVFIMERIPELDVEGSDDDRTEKN